MDTKTKSFTAAFLVGASFHSALIAASCVISTCHSPSRSISYTLIASWVLSGRTSLAGSVCLLWIAGDTEWDDGCMSLMNGCAPATDMVQLHSSRTSTAPSLSTPLTTITLVGPCQQKNVEGGFIKKLWISGSFTFEYWQPVNEGRSQVGWIITGMPSISEGSERSWIDLTFKRCHSFEKSIQRCISMIANVVCWSMCND